jgi:hypothetical protein
MAKKQPALDCQDCGNEVMKLTDAQAQQVAANPYNFVVYCQSCKMDRMREAQRNGW